MRCDLNNKINLDALVGRLTTFELDNYDNYVCSSINLEYEFKDKLSLKKKATKGKNSKSEEEDYSSSNLESIEALLTKRYPKGKGKYKGKISLVRFPYEEVSHIVARCLNREGKEEKKNKYKNKKIFKSYKN